MSKNNKQRQKSKSGQKPRGNNRKRLGPRRNRKANRNKQMSVYAAPTAFGSTMRTRNPLRNLTVSHREYITDINSNGTGTQTIEFEVNPGLPVAFPWLSTLANSFETYVFTKLQYIFVPTLSTNTNGAVAFCPDYDAADDNSTKSKTELMSFQDSIRGNLWSGMTMSCTSSNLHKQKQFFVRSDVLVNNLDIKMYDVLRLFVVLSDALADGEIVGELWVDYTIQLQTPQLNSIAIDVQSWSTVSNADYDYNYPLYSKTSTSVGNMLSEGVIGKANPLTDIWAKTIKFFQPGSYQFVLYMNGIQDDFFDSYSVTYESDTGDVEAFVEREVILRQGNPSITTMIMKAFFNIGRLVSKLNPVTITFDPISLSLGAVCPRREWSLSKMDGFTLPTVSKREHVKQTVTFQEKKVKCRPTFNDSRDLKDGISAES
jgi:hypothetical protein